MHDLGQVALIGHHFVNVLVRARNFIDHTLVLAADHSFGLTHEVGRGETLRRRRATHSPVCAVGTGTETLGAAFAAHDVAARPHGLEPVDVPDRLRRGYDHVT